MNSGRASVHERHENTRTKPKNFISMMFNLKSEEPYLRVCTERNNACVSHFVPFVFFVDNGLEGSL